MGESGTGPRRRTARLAAGIFCLFAIGLIGGAYVNGLSSAPAEGTPRATSTAARVAAPSPAAIAADALADRLSRIVPTAGAASAARATPAVAVADLAPQIAAAVPVASVQPAEPAQEGPRPRHAYRHRRLAAHRRHESVRRVAAVFPASGGLYRIQFGSFASAAQAQRIARTIETHRLKISVTALRGRRGHALYLVRSQMFRSQSDADAAAASARRAIRAKHLDNHLPVVIRHMTVEEASGQRHEQLAERGR